jgi:hypothetical protein
MCSGNRRRRRVKITRSNPNASTAGPTEEQDQSTDERGDKANVPSNSQHILILGFQVFFSFDMTAAMWDYPDHQAERSRDGEHGDASLRRLRFKPMTSDQWLDW